MQGVGDSAPAAEKADQEEEERGGPSDPGKGDQGGKDAACPEGTAAEAQTVPFMLPRELEGFRGNGNGNAYGSDSRADKEHHEEGEKPNKFRQVAGHEASSLEAARDGMDAGEGVR